MNQAIKQLELDPGKYLFVFVYLVNESSSSLSLGSSIKQVKLKHNKVFVNKLVGMRFDLTIYNIIWLYVYKYEHMLA